MYTDQQRAVTKMANETWLPKNTPFQEVIKWLFSEGWFFNEPDLSLAEPNMKLLLQDIKNNKSYSNTVEVLELLPNTGNYMKFKTYNMSEPTQLLWGEHPYGAYQGQAGTEVWPNDVISSLIHLHYYQAINKKVINK